MAHTAPLLAADSPVAVEREYIVVLRDDVTAEQGILNTELESYLIIIIPVFT